MASRTGSADLQPGDGVLRALALAASGHFENQGHAPVTVSFITADAPQAVQKRNPGVW